MRIRAAIARDSFWADFANTLLLRPVHRASRVEAGTTGPGPGRTHGEELPQSENTATKTQAMTTGDGRAPEVQDSNPSRDQQDREQVLKNRTNAANFSPSILDPNSPIAPKISPPGPSQSLSLGVRSNKRNQPVYTPSYDWLIGLGLDQLQASIVRQLYRGGVPLMAARNMLVPESVVSETLERLGERFGVSPNDANEVPNYFDLLKPIARLAWRDHQAGVSPHPVFDISPAGGTIRSDLSRYEPEEEIPADPVLERQEARERERQRLRNLRSSGMR